MDATFQAQLSIVALVCSLLALFFSLMAAFPGLKDVLAAIRDGVLWFCLFVVLGGAAFLVWQQFEPQIAMSVTAGHKASSAWHIAGQHASPASH